MLEVYSLLFICTILAFGIKKTIFYEYADGINTNYCTPNGRFIRFLLIAILVWFAGLRTVMNDTGIYITSFSIRIPDTIAGLAEVNWSIGDNPLFIIYQILIKTFISQNGQVFIFVTALIVEVSMVKFLFKYSVDFGFSVYFFLAFTVYAFTMAAIKQTLATSIAIWAMPEFVKGKRTKALLIILLSALIHPYVVLFATAYFIVNKGVWNRTIELIIAATVVFSAFFYSIMGRVLTIAELIGDNYDMEWFEAGTGVGIMRIFAYLIPSILAFLSRNELRKTDSSLQHLFVNMTIIASCLSILSGFGGSVLFGRLPNYFDIFICVSFPFVLNHMNPSLNRMSGFIKPMLMIAYLFYYSTYYNKYFARLSNPWTADIYARTSFLTLFQS